MKSNLQQIKRIIRKQSSRKYNNVSLFTLSIKNFNTLFNSSKKNFSETIDQTVRNSMAFINPTPSALNPVADILNNEIQKIKNNGIDYKQLDEAFNLIIHNTYDLSYNLDTLKNNTNYAEINIVKFDELLLEIANHNRNNDKNIPANMLLSIIKVGTLLNSDTNTYCSTVINLVEDIKDDFDNKNKTNTNNKNNKITNIDMIDALFLLKNTSLRKDLFTYVFNNVSPIVNSNTETLQKEIKREDYMTIIKYFNVFPLTITPEFSESLQQILIKSYSTELESNNFALLRTLLKNIYVSFTNNITFDLVIDHFVDKVRNDFTILNTISQVELLGIFSYYAYIKKNHIVQEQATEDLLSQTISKIKKLFDHAEEEILDSNFSNFRFTEIISIIDSYSSIGFGSSELFLEIEKYLAHNINKLPPSSYLNILSSLTDNKTIREKFILLLQKQIIEKYEQIEISDIAKILEIFALKLKNNSTVFEKLEGYLAINLDKFSTSELIVLLKSYASKKINNANSKFLIISDIELKLRNNPPSSLQQKAELVDSLVAMKSLEIDFIKTLISEILSANKETLDSENYETIDLIYSSISGAKELIDTKSYKVLVNSLSKLDIVVVKKLPLFNKDSLNNIKSCLEIVGYNSNHYLVSLIKEIIAIEEKYEGDISLSQACFNEKLRLVSSVMNGLIKNVMKEVEVDTKI